jgi:hypothetical protein
MATGDAGSDGWGSVFCRPASSCLACTPGRGHRSTGPLSHGRYGGGRRTSTTGTASRPGRSRLARRPSAPGRRRHRSLIRAARGGRERWHVRWAPSRNGHARLRRRGRGQGGLRAVLQRRRPTGTANLVLGREVIPVRARGDCDRCFQSHTPRWLTRLPPGRSLASSGTELGRRRRIVRTNSRTCRGSAPKRRPEVRTGLLADATARDCLPKSRRQTLRTFTYG